MYTKLSHLKQGKKKISVHHPMMGIYRNYSALTFLSYLSKNMFGMKVSRWVRLGEENNDSDDDNISIKV